EEFSMDPEELEQVLATVSAEEISENKAAESGFELPVPETGKEQQQEQQQQQKITVTVEESTQSVKLTADENGNVVSTKEVTPKEETKDQGSSKERENPENGKSGQGFENTNFSVESLFKNQTQSTEAVFEQIQTSAEAANSSQEIMDQILDYMKIQLKPEMDQLEMQLHPESLGTLRVQITAKSGEVTAQFQVQNESVKAAIENQIGVLKDTLREQGVKVEAVEVTVESHAFESNLWQGKERDDGSSYQGNRKSPRRINLNALDESFEKEADEGDLLAAEMMKANGGTVDYTA
ncbi:MAG: flagellar hook-length control protein FliK, partial [Suilimivivens sp.]